MALCRSLEPVKSYPDGRHQLRPRPRRLSHSDSPTPLTRHARRLPAGAKAHSRSSSTNHDWFGDEGGNSRDRPSNLLGGFQRTESSRESALFNPSATSISSLSLKRGLSVSNLSDHFASMDIESKPRRSIAMGYVPHAPPFFRGQFSSTWSTSSASFKRFPGSIPLNIPEEEVHEIPKALRCVRDSADFTIL